MIRKIVALLVLIAGIVSWDQYLYPPLAHYLDNPDAGFTGTVAELLKPKNAIYHDGILLGWVFVFASALLLAGLLLLAIKALRWAIFYIADAETAFSILSIDVTLHVHDEAFVRATVSRAQKMHANRKDVSAYYTEFSTDSPNGRIDKNSVEADSFIGGTRVTLKPNLKRGNEKRVDFIERFTRPLPVSIFATYLSNGAVLRLLRLGAFSRTIVERNSSIDYYDEYNESEPIFQLTAARYPVATVRVAFDFPEVTAPSESDISAFLLRRNAVETLDLIRSTTGGRCVYVLTLQHFKDATLRVEWSNRRLDRWKAAPKP